MMNKRYKVLTEFIQFDSDGEELFRLHPNQEIRKGVNDHSLCIANPKGDGCQPNQQWVAIIDIGMSVDGVIAKLLNAGMIKENDEN